MLCREVMTGNPKCCVPSDTIGRAAKLMKTSDIGAVPVCEDRHGKKLVGIVTDRDLVVNVLAEGREPNSIKVQDVMTRDPFACQADDELDTALDSMSSHRVRRIPVLGNAGELIGMISQADIAVRTGWPEKTAEVVSNISRPSTMRAG